MAWVATAIVGGSIISGKMASDAQSSAANTAADAQGEATKLGIEEQRRQFDALQELLSPYVKAGESALTQQQGLLGLGGAEAQQAQFDLIESSPQFQSMIQSGENAILQNSSATGGLRGGNVQSALGQYRPQLLSQQIQNQFSNLGQLTNIGQASAAGVGNMGQAMGNNVSNLLGQGGRATAQAALAGGQATAQAWGDFSGAVGLAAGLKAKF